MRFVSQEVDSCIGNEPGNSANFGLYFNKWIGWNLRRGVPEIEVSRDKAKILGSFGKTRIKAGQVLKQRHVQQAKYCRAMEKAGWTSLVVEADLVSPFVSGLGMTHPTETGLVLDHTSGMPYLPAASLKGVQRVAHIVNSLVDDNGTWLSKDELQKLNIIDSDNNWLEDDFSKTLYGTGGNQDALAGQAVILDAYPLTPPELDQDIMNPHYNDYYQGNRGPTEDQMPVPVKFLVVKPGVRFVFRMMLRLPFGNAPVHEQAMLKEKLQRNIERAIEEIGIGAKTALGLGRFKILSNTEPRQVDNWILEEDDKRFPWKKCIREVEKIADWGQLKQKVLDNGCDAFKMRLVHPEVAEAVKEIALRIRKKHRKKWSDERDKEVAQWFEDTGIEWVSFSAESTSHKPGEKSPKNGEDQLLAIIESLKNFKEYGKRKKELSIKSLSLICCEALEKQFRAWKCNKAKKKTNEAKEWQKLQKRIKNLRK